MNRGPVSMSQIRNVEKYLGNSSDAKQTTLGATMGCKLHLWVAYGDWATGLNSLAPGKFEWNFR